MFEQKHLKIHCGSNISECIIEFSTSEPCELKLLSVAGGMVEYTCQGLDLFDCLATIRSQYFEKKDCLILCNGARLDVYPSRMSRQMSLGRKAYILHLGQQAQRTDIVDIFDPVEDSSCIASVAEQNDFYKKWLTSLGL